MELQIYSKKPLDTHLKVCRALFAYLFTFVFLQVNHAIIFVNQFQTYDTQNLLHISHIILEIYCIFEFIQL